MKKLIILLLFTISLNSICGESYPSHYYSLLVYHDGDLSLAYPLDENDEMTFKKFKDETELIKFIKNKKAPNLTDIQCIHYLDMPKKDFLKFVKKLKKKLKGHVKIHDLGNTAPKLPTLPPPPPQYPHRP